MRRCNKLQLMKYSNIKRVDNYLFQYTEDFSFCIKTSPEYVTYGMILSRCNEIGSDYYFENSIIDSSFNA